MLTVWLVRLVPFVLDMQIVLARFEPLVVTSLLAQKPLVSLAQSRQRLLVHVRVVPDYVVPQELGRPLHFHRERRRRRRVV